MNVDAGRHSHVADPHICTFPYRSAIPPLLLISCSTLTVRAAVFICMRVEGPQPKESGPLPSPLPPPCQVFRYLFVYSSFAWGVNNFNVTACCRGAALNLHVSDDKRPKTKMLIAAAANRRSLVGGSVRCHRRYLYSRRRRRHSAASSAPRRSRRCWRRRCLCPPSPPSGGKTLIFMLADKGNYFLIACRNTDTSGR